MLIGIGGCSRSGKTELAEALVWYFRQNHQRAFSIHQDNYVLGLEQIPNVNNAPDWDTPLSIDFDLLNKSIDFYQPYFDVLVVEGIYAFNDSAINERYDRRLYVEISKDIFLQRRSAETRWGVEPDWYLEHVWQSHLKHGVISSKFAHYQVISGENPCEIDEIVAAIA